MRIDLTAAEFATLQRQINHLNSIVHDEHARLFDVHEAEARRRGVMTTLHVLGFTVERDEQGNVIDIYQR